MRDLVGQRQRSDVLSRFDGGDRLPRRSHGQRQFLLRELLRLAQFSDSGAQLSFLLTGQNAMHALHF